MRLTRLVLTFILSLLLLITSAPVLAVDLTVEVLPYLRGDADGDGDVDIFDAMFIAQYLVGMRGIDELNFLNAATVKHDEPEDIIDIFDAMYIAQFLVGLRDSNFEWID